MGLLQPARPTLHHAGRRGLVFAGIAGLHVAAVAGLMNMTMLPPPATAVSEPIHAVLLQSEAPQQARPKLEPQFRLPDIEVPPVLIAPQWTPPQPTAIRVSTHSEPQPAAPAAAVTAVIDADIPVELQTVDYLQRVEPRYPPVAKRARAQGTVFLRVIIGTDGRPREVRVERSSGHEVLDAAARSAVEKWLFRPYSENGIARAASVIVPIEFAISARRG